MAAACGCAEGAVNLKIRDIMVLLKARVLTPDDDLEKGMPTPDEILDKEVLSACGSDMMSDVLAYVKNQSVLLTGLNNPQVVRTADMMGMVCIVFVRGKKPDQSVLKLAKSCGIVVLATDHTMFTSCGRLYEKGLRGRCPQQ